MTDERSVAHAPRPVGIAEPCRGTRGELAAAGLVPAPPEQVFEFLADLENHWALADRFIDVLDLSGPPGARDGGRVRLRGPLGSRRTATTRVEAAHAPNLMIGTAEMEGPTRACVSWTLTPSDGGTSVRLTATLDHAGLLDRLLLLLGGRWWMRRRFVAVLVKLADRFGPLSTTAEEG
jgi:uncharacterized protein YndB with AHSA1/START domain